MTEKHELIVRTLGDFTITWQGHQISGGSRDSQFARLMGILLHYSETGVERGRLEDMLFEDSSSMDPHHMLRTVIYNAKKKLEKAGLPSGCIEFRNGVYGWTKDITVVEDAREFERMVQEAEELGADAVVNIRYASSAIMQGAAEVMAYGTAVKFV